MWLEALAGVSGRRRRAAARARLSVFVVSYNRAALLRTCLSAVQFADEVIVVDKSSTDHSVAVARELADRVISVPWSPTVEETRGFALAQCTSDWVLCLDDDECLSPEAVAFIDVELRAPRADIYVLPLRHYVLGRHDERAYYWPEGHPRLFRRGAVSFRGTVHAGLVEQGGRRFEVPADTGACIHHLSHRDAAEWVAKTNRYTSRPDRHQAAHDGADLVGFAHDRLDAWMAATRGSDGSDYPAAVAVLRAVYDMVDRVKAWEAAAALDGAAEFAEIGERLEQAYAERLRHLRRPRRRQVEGLPPGEDALSQVRLELEAIRASTCWRATGPLRWLVDRVRGKRPMPHRGRLTGGEGRVQGPRPESIAFPTSATPVVSVIVPTFGKVEYSLRCLASMAEHLPATPIEVLVVDDASHDPEVAALTRVRGIRLLTNETNLGFVRSCNAAARQAVGDFVLFLNNDTEVQPGWLDPMVALLGARPDAGAAGAMLLFPDGRLQEAGGIVWRDGTGWTFGRGDDPDLPQYNYVREVDYASGAALLVRRALFEQLGGFDDTFVPAYCEDSDLAFRIRAAGYKVLYQPLSRVVHFEGVSNGTDPTRGVKRFNDINQRKLVAKWAAVLASGHYPHGEQVLRARERGRGRRLVLVLADSATTAAETIAELLGSAALVKLWARDPTGADALRQRGVDVLAGGKVEGLRLWLCEHGAALDAAIVADDRAADAFLADLYAVAIPTVAPLAAWRPAAAA